MTHTPTIDDSQHDSHDVSVHSAPVIDCSVRRSSLHESSIYETTHHVSGLDAHPGF